MKKTIALLLITLLALGVTALAEEGALIGNPWEECDAVTLEAALGFGFALPEDAENIVYRMNTQEGLAEADFTWQDMEYTARMRACEAFEDISGLYYVWTYEDECEVNGCEGSCLRGFDEGTTIDLCLFYDAEAGLMYSVSASDTDLDGFDILAIAEAIYVPAQ